MTSKKILFLSFAIILCLLFFYFSYERFINESVTNDLEGTYLYYDEGNEICAMTLEKSPESEVVTATFFYYQIKDGKKIPQDAPASEFLVKNKEIYLHEGCEDHHHHDEEDFVPLATYEFRDKKLFISFIQTNKTFEKIENQVLSYEKIKHLINNSSP